MTLLNLNWPTPRTRFAPGQEISHAPSTPASFS